MGRPTIRKEIEEKDTRYWCEQIVLFLRQKKFDSLTPQEAKAFEAMSEEKQEKFLRVSNRQIELMLEPPNEGHVRDGKQFGRWLRAGSTGGQRMTHDDLQRFVTKARRRKMLPPKKEGGLILNVPQEERIAQGAEMPESRLKASVESADELFQARLSAISGLRRYALAMKNAPHVMVYDPVQDLGPSKPRQGKNGISRFTRLVDRSIAQRGTDATMRRNIPSDTYDETGEDYGVSEINVSEIERMALLIERHAFAVPVSTFPVEWCKTGAITTRKSNKAKINVKGQK